MHDRLIEELRAVAGRRKRLLAVECDESLLEIAPQMLSDPGRRGRLRELLSELAELGELTWSASRDRTVRPELPAFVTLVEPSEGPGPDGGAPDVPWRPELEWAYALRLTESEREVLATVQTYRRDRRDVEPIPHRERSLQLFKDEKRLDRLVRGRLFGPERLTLDLLDCHWAPPPIAWCRTGRVGPVVVSENAAGYHTLVKVLAGTARAVAYGAGGAFAQSVAGLAELDFAIPTLLYIGDLDAEGLAIPQRAATTAATVDIPAPMPYEELWSMLVDMASEYGQQVPAVPTEVAVELCGWFKGSGLGKAVQHLLETGLRVPQEALSVARLQAKRIGHQERGCVDHEELVLTDHGADCIPETTQ